MMKPDTPKFVSDNRIMLWARQIGAELNFIREKQKHGGLKAAEMQTTILTERYAEVLDFALRGIKADLVAAPKPDCVGVEERQKLFDRIAFARLPTANFMRGELPIGISEDCMEAIQELMHMVGGK